MFQYTNTIVLNSLKDVTTGLDKIVKGSDNIEVRRKQVPQEERKCYAQENCFRPSYW